MNKPKSETHVCSVCQREFGDDGFGHGFGNNAQPINDGRYAMVAIRRSSFRRASTRSQREEIIVTRADRVKRQPQFPTTKPRKQNTMNTDHSTIRLRHMRQPTSKQNNTRRIALPRSGSYNNVARNARKKPVRQREAFVLAEIATKRAMESADRRSRTETNRVHADGNVEPQTSREHFSDASSENTERRGRSIRQPIFQQPTTTPTKGGESKCQRNQDPITP